MTGSPSRPSDALARALWHLTKETNAGRHAHCDCHQHHQHHEDHEWFLQLDTWGQLELLRQLLCRRSPEFELSEELLQDIDTVLSHQHSHVLLAPSDSLHARHIVNRTRISVWKGDITTLSNVTAIVNAANSSLLGCFQPSHRCIDNVIHSAAGPRLRQACFELMKQGHDEPVGRAKVTAGFILQAPYVIHTVGPELGHGHSPSSSHREQLRDCYVSCLEAMEAIPALPDGRKVIAFCCISTGLFAFPCDIAAQIAIDTVSNWCTEHPETTITDIIFDTFLQRDFDLYNAKISSLVFSSSDSVQIAPILPQPTPIPSLSMRTARSWLKQADYLLISAGAGLSAATGLDYTSPDLFAEHFPAFLPLGLRRLYDVFGFNGWKSRAQKWGYYFHHLNMVRTWPKSPLYASLLEIATRFASRCFIRTSNADELFSANGFHPSRISTPQGQYAYLQCFPKCRREAVFPSAPFLAAAVPFLDPQTQLLTDESKIPRCRYCNGELTLCVRGGDYFNDSLFQGQEREYTRFLEHVSSEMEQGRNAVILELGVGMNTPSVLRWHNEELVEESNGWMRLIRAGLDAAGCVPWRREEEGVAVGVAGNLNAVVELLR